MIQSYRNLFLLAITFCFSIAVAEGRATAQDTGTSNPIAVIFLEGDVPQDIELPPTVTRAAAWGLDIFVGGEIDLVGIFGIELGDGIVIDLDTPLDSGIYISVGTSGGLNVGVGVGGGIAIGDIEGNTGTLDVNAGPGSGVIGLGEDGSVVIGGSYGPGVGASVSYGPTGTLSIGMVVDAVCWVVGLFF
jgi:hypothetical protein